MPISVRICSAHEISSLREAYRGEMRCQIIHDSIHGRPGWTVEYLLEMDGAAAGYGSVAIAGPWRTEHTLYEFFIARNYRRHVFDLFAALRAGARPSRSRPKPTIFC